MSLENSAVTAAMVAGTIFAALGLSLGVLRLNEDSSTTAGSEPEPVVQTALALEAESPAPFAAADRPNRSPAGGQGQVVSSSTAAEAAATSPAVGATATPAGESVRSTSAPGEHDFDDLNPEDDAAITATTLQPAPVATPPTTTQPPGTEPRSTDVSGSAAPSEAIPASTEYRTIEFEGVASIIVAVHDGHRLEFWSATPSPGWAYLVEDDSPSKVKLKFRPKSGGDEAEFEVRSSDGEIEIKREY